MMSERQARARLDSWRFWITMFGFGLAILTVGMIYLVNAKFSQDADRRAQQKIANTAQVSTCVASARSTPGVLRVLDLLDVLTTNSILSNKGALKADPNGPLSDVRKKSLERLRPALPAIKEFRTATKAGQRMISDCRALAAKLAVDIEPLLKEGKT